MVNILGSFAEFERELINWTARVRGRRHKVEVRKEYLGCRPGSSRVSLAVPAVHIR